MVGPYERCGTLMAIEPVRDHAIALRESSSTDDNGGDQRLLEIWRTHLAAIQKQPPSVPNDVVKKGRPFRG